MSRPNRSHAPSHAVRTVAAWAVLLLLAPGTGEAQQAATGTVRGQLVRDGPVAGVAVTVRGTDRADTTDANGEFLIDGVPAGSRVLEARLPWQSRFELPPFEHSVTVRSGDTVDVEVEVPGNRSLAARACRTRDRATERERGVFVGQLVGHGTDEPLRNVRMRVAWSDSVSADRRRTGSRLVRTDSVGRFTVCGIPQGTALQALVGTGRYGRRTGSLRMPEEGFLARRIRYVGPSDAPVGRPSGNGELVAGPRSPDYVLEPLTVPISPETGLAGFRHRRENLDGFFFTREEILASNPRQLTDVFQDRSVPKVRVEYEYPGRHSGPYRLRIFDPDGPGYWCTPGLIVDGNAVPYRWVREGKWSLNRYDPEDVVAMEVYWKPGEVPKAFRGGVAADLRNLWPAASGRSGEAARTASEPAGQQRPSLRSMDRLGRCGTVVLWTGRSGRLAELGSE